MHEWELPEHITQAMAEVSELWGSRFAEMGESMAAANREAFGGFFGGALVDPGAWLTPAREQFEQLAEQFRLHGEPDFSGLLHHHGFDWASLGVGISPDLWERALTVLATDPDAVAQADEIAHLVSSVQGGPTLVDTVCALGLFLATIAICLSATDEAGGAAFGGAAGACFALAEWLHRNGDD